MTTTLHDGERDWLTRVVDNLADDDLKLVYADWLDERGDERAEFLRQLVAATRSMEIVDFPKPPESPIGWSELVGHDLLSNIAENCNPKFKETAIRLARPALRMEVADKNDRDMPVGSSKIGGLPDLPAGFDWPLGHQCKAIYNDDTKGVEELAGFMAQVNLAEIAQTQAGRLLPSSGVLSFFCFQDLENDNPDVIGAAALLLPEPDQLVRTEPPRDFIEGNETMESQRLSFVETLDLPESYDGPWSDDFKPFEEEDYEGVCEHLRMLNFDNMLGHGRATTSGDPTPNRQSRHLIILNNPGECRLHIQIPEKELAARNFDAITLDWVDFDP